MNRILQCCAVPGAGRVFPSYRRERNQPDAVCDVRFNLKMSSKKYQEKIKNLICRPRSVGRSVGIKKNLRRFFIRPPGRTQDNSLSGTRGARGELSGWLGNQDVRRKQ